MPQGIALVSNHDAKTAALWRDGGAKICVMAGLYRSDGQADQVRAWCRERMARWPVPHQTHAIDTSCGMTHVVSAGEGDRVCVYLPGTNFNAASSTVLLAALGSSCRVYAATCRVNRV